MKRIIQVSIVLLTTWVPVLAFGQSSIATGSQDVSAHREGFVTAEGVRLHYLDWSGQGPNLVFLTGFGSTAHEFDHLAEYFSPRFRVVALTRRGRAPSDQPSTGYDLAHLTADVKAVLDALAIRQAHFVGHSMAGTEMIQFARLWPERALSMVFIDAAVDPAAAWRVWQLDPQGPPNPPVGSVSEQIDRWWASHEAQFEAIRVPALAMYAIEDRHPYPMPGTAPDMRALLDEYWTTEWNPMVERTAERFRREVAQGRVVMIKGPHYLHRDKEAEVIREMEAFYDTVLGK